jgi:hypothetical protein
MKKNITFLIAYNDFNTRLTKYLSALVVGFQKLLDKLRYYLTIIFLTGQNACAATGQAALYALKHKNIVDRNTKNKKTQVIT